MKSPQFFITAKTDFVKCNLIRNLFGRKEYIMAMRKTGLHKDVSRIFDGVWNPEVDNIQESFDEPEANFANYVRPGHNGFNSRPQEARLGTMAKVFKAPGYFLSPRRRRERKRLSSISKHLLINIPS